MEAVRARRLPFVGVDFDPADDLVRVSIDDRAAARSAAEHLTALGHRRFGIVLAHDAPDAHQLSVTGFDDVPEAALADPPLTTIRQPHHTKGSEAVRLLLEGEAARSVLLPTELVVRASTAPAP